MWAVIASQATSNANVASLVRLADSNMSALQSQQVAIRKEVRAQQERIKYLEDRVEDLTETNRLLVERLRENDREDAVPSEGARDEAARRPQPQQPLPARRFMVDFKASLLEDDEENDKDNDDGRTGMAKSGGDDDAKGNSDDRDDDHDDDDDDDDENDDDNDNDSSSSLSSKPPSSTSSSNNRTPPCTTSVVMFYSKNHHVLRCIPSSFAPPFSNPSWDSRPDFSLATPDVRASLFSVADSLLASSSSSSFSAASPLPPDAYKTLSLLLLYEGSVPVCLALFSLSVQATRVVVGLREVCTSLAFRNRGNGSLAVALLKELAVSNPQRARSDQAILCCCCEKESGPFFFSRRQGLKEGWGTLAQLYDPQDLADMRDDGILAHVPLSKHLLGEYARACLSGGDPHPTLDKQHAPRSVNHSSVAEFPIGSTVDVFYPTITSKKKYRAIILDYNPNLPKPYFIQYFEGSLLDRCVAKRLVKVDDDIPEAKGGGGGGKKKPAKKGGGGEEAALQHDLFGFGNNIGNSSSPAMLSFAPGSQR